MYNTKENKQFESWKEVVSDFIKQREERKIVELLSKKNPKKTLDDKEQAINLQIYQFLEKDGGVRERAKKILEEKNTGKPKLKKIDFHLGKYEKLVSLNPDSLEIGCISNIFNKKRENILRDHIPSNWLDYYAKYAGGVGVSTHVSKLAHSSIKGASSFYVEKCSSRKYSYISTSDLSKPAIDCAIDNAAYTPVAHLLNLRHEDKSLADLLSIDDESPFLGITSSHEKIMKWIQMFKLALFAEIKSSHILAKQVYFPVEEKKYVYNLLCNVKSSTMAHAIFEKLSSKSKEGGGLALNNKYYSDKITKYYGKATLAVTSVDSAKNVSPLNSKRRGKLSLFSCQPPIWKSQLKPPAYRKSLFDNLYNTIIKTEVDYLRDFLLRFNNLGLSIKDPKRKRHLERWVDSIIDEFLFYVGSIQALPSGWTDIEGTRLKAAHQYLLDPYRQDEEFQNSRQSTDWQSSVHADFAQWLNFQLRGKDKQFTPKEEHTRLWKKQLSAPLREYMEPIEIDVKQQRKEAV